MLIEDAKETRVIATARQALCQGGSHVGGWEPRLPRTMVEKNISKNTRTLDERQAAKGEKIEKKSCQARRGADWGLHVRPTNGRTTANLLLDTQYQDAIITHRPNNPH